MGTELAPSEGPSPTDSSVLEQVPLNLAALRGGHAPPNAIALDSLRAGDLVPEAGCYFTGDFAPRTKKIIVVKCYPSGYYITGDFPPGVQNLGGVPNHRDTGTGTAI